MLLAFISLLLSACCVNPILAASPDVQGSSLTEGPESDAIASLQKWAEAEATYQRWAALKPADEKPKLALGDFYVIMGQGDKALAAYEQARAINPTVAREKIIEYYLNAKKPDEAERLVKELLAKNTKDGAGRFYQARLLMARGKPSDAIEVLQGVLKDDPKS